MIVLILDWGGAKKIYCLKSILNIVGRCVEIA